MPQKLLFLTSTKFWAFMILSVVLYFRSVGVIDVAVADMLVTMLGGYIGLNITNKVVTAISK